MPDAETLTFFPPRYLFTKRPRDETFPRCPDTTPEQRVVLHARTKEQSRIKEIGEALKVYIDFFGLTDEEKWMRSQHEPTFRVYMLGKLVTEGWLHGDAYERFCGFTRYPDPSTSRKVMTVRLRYGAGPNGEMGGPAPTKEEREEIEALLRGDVLPEGMTAKERMRRNATLARLKEFKKAHPFTQAEAELWRRDREKGLNILLGNAVLCGWLHPFDQFSLNIMYGGKHPWWLHPEDWPAPFSDTYPEEDINKAPSWLNETKVDAWSVAKR